MKENWREQETNTSTESQSQWKMESAQVVRVPGESPDGQDLVEVHTNNEHQSCGLLRSFMSECTISVGKGSSYSILDPSCV